MWPVAQEQQPQPSAPHQCLCSQSSTKILLPAVMMLLVLVLGLHTRDIWQLNSSLRQVIEYQQEMIGNLTMTERSVNHTAATFNIKYEMVEKGLELLRQQTRLKVMEMNSSLGSRVKNLTSVVEEVEAAVSNIQRKQRYSRFMSRNQKMEKIFNRTKPVNLGLQQQKYHDQLNLTRANIPNQYHFRQQRENHTLRMNELMHKEYERYQSKYNIDRYSKELSMCIVVSTRDNTLKDRYLYNLHSMLNQNYSNYRIVIMDDASDDGTGLLLKRELRKLGVAQDKATVIIRPRRHGSLNNIHYAMHNHCKEYNVTLPIDGDDQLIGKYVLKLINAVYQSKNPGYAYTQHIYYMEEEEEMYQGYSAPYSELSIQKQNYRKIKQKFGHLRSFKTELFFKIRQVDLRDQAGNFWMASGDEAFTFPIMEMSCDRVQFIDEIAYLYNAGTGFNVRFAQNGIQAINAHDIRLLPKYQCHQSLAAQANVL